MPAPQRTIHAGAKSDLAVAAAAQQGLYSSTRLQLIGLLTAAQPALSYSTASIQWEGSGGREGKEMRRGGRYGSLLL